MAISPFPWIGICFGKKKFDPLAKKFIDGLITKPSIEHQLLVNNFVKTAGVKDIITQKADVMYLGNINDSNDSFRNLAKDAHHGTKQGSGLVWDSFWGYSNPAGTGYVDTNYNPSTQGVRYTLNDAGIGCYLFNADVPDSFPIIGGSGSIYTGIRFDKLNSSNYYFMNGGGLSINVNSLPFKSGFHLVKTIISTSAIYGNQNTANVTTSNTTSAKANGQICLFKRIDLSSLIYTGGLNFTYIGASLTDAEFTILNNAYNDYLIQCLFLKYGQDNWGVKMAKSYFLNLHSFEKYEAWEVYEFIKRMQPDYVDGAVTGYYYNTFGPSGQNKTVCDFLMLFKAGGNLISNAWTKSGAVLRWNQDGGIANSNTMPAYTRATNLGIVTVTSTDGWNGVTGISMINTYNSVNSLYGNFPNFLGVLKTAGIKCSLTIVNNRVKLDFSGQNIKDLCNNFAVYNIIGVGWIKLNINKLLGGYYSTIQVTESFTYTYGDVTPFTNEAVANFIFRANKSVYGSLRNMTFASTGDIQIYIDGTNVSEGLSTWNKYIRRFDAGSANFSTANVNSLLALANTYYSINVPIKNLELSLGGASMGIPTGGASNADLLGIIAKHTAAGFTATITVRTV